MLNQYLQILILLDSDVRRDVFIGMIGILIAIVIFIAEFITKQKYETYKKAFLKTIRLKEKTLFILFSMFLIIIVSLITPPEVNGGGNTCIYVFLQTVLNIFILLSFVFAAQLLLSALKISSEQMYSEESIFSYVKDRIEKLCKKEKQVFQKYSQKRKDFERYLSNTPNFSIDPFLVHTHKEEYVEIKTNCTGYIKGYKTSYINRLYRASLRDKSDYDEKQLPNIVFTKTVGDSVSAGTTIAYYKKNTGNIYKTLNKAVSIDTKYAQYIDEIDNIVKEMIAFAREDERIFDKNNRLLNFFKFICEKNLKKAKEKMLENLEDYSRSVLGSQESIKITRWLSQVSYEAYEKDCFDEYSKISDLIEWLYLDRRKLEGYCAEKVAYEFANNHFLIPYITIKGSNNKYYDKLLATLLGMINGFIRADEYRAVWVLFDNIFFEEAEYIFDDEEKVNSLHFQFACGTILCLFQKSIKANVMKENSSEIKNIVEYIRDHFIGIHNAWIFIKCFKQYYGSPSQIQGRYKWFDSYEEENEYKNSWTGVGIEEQLIIRIMLYIFDINQGFISNESEIKREDRFYYEMLRDSVENGFNSKLEQLLEHPYNSNPLVELLSNLINVAKRAEEEYITNEKLIEEKTSSFSSILEKEACNETKLVKYLGEIGKINICKDKIKRHLGFNTLIPRELFLESYFGGDDIAKSYGKAIPDSIEANYLDSIPTTKSNVPIDNELNSIDNPSDYLIIADHMSMWHLTKNQNDYVKTSRGSIKVINSRNVDGAILVKKDCLPILEYCDFDDKLKDCMRKDYIAYCLRDCSTDDNLRREIIETSEWINEKGDKEDQEKFLKRQCNLKLFAACRIGKYEGDAALLFEDTD